MTEVSQGSKIENLVARGARLAVPAFVLTGALTAEQVLNPDEVEAQEMSVTLDNALLRQDYPVEVFCNEDGVTIYRTIFPDGSHFDSEGELCGSAPTTTPTTIAPAESTIPTTESTMPVATTPPTTATIAPTTAAISPTTRRQTTTTSAPATSMATSTENELDDSTTTIATETTTEPKVTSTAKETSTSTSTTNEIMNDEPTVDEDVVAVVPIDNSTTGPDNSGGLDVAKTGLVVGGFASLSTLLVILGRRKKHDQQPVNSKGGLEVA